MRASWNPGGDLSALRCISIPTVPMIRWRVDRSLVSCPLLCRFLLVGLVRVRVPLRDLVTTHNSMNVG